MHGLISSIFGTKPRDNNAYSSPPHFIVWFIDILI